MCDGKYEHLALHCELFPDNEKKKTLPSKHGQFQQLVFARISGDRAYLLKGASDKPSLAAVFHLEPRVAGELRSVPGCGWVSSQ